MNEQTNPEQMMSPEREELFHQACSRGGILYNEVIALRTTHNNLLAAVILEGVETAARILERAVMNADMEVGIKLKKIGGMSHGEKLWKERP